MVPKLERIVDWQTEILPQVSHDFGLFHRINSQLTLQVLIEFDEVDRVASVLCDRLNYSR